MSGSATRRALADEDGQNMSAVTYSQSIISGDIVWVSGQLGIHEATGEVAEDARQEVDLALGGVDRALQAGGWELADVMKVTVFVTDLAAVYEHLNAAFREHFQRPFPARSTVQVAALVKGARVEIEAVACRRRPV